MYWAITKVLIETSFKSFQYNTEGRRLSNYSINLVLCSDYRSRYKGLCQNKKHGFDQYTKECLFLRSTYDLELRSTLTDRSRSQGKILRFSWNVVPKVIYNAKQRILAGSTLRKELNIPIKKKNKRKTRGPKGHISCIWVQCATSLTEMPGRLSLFFVR